MLAENNPIIDEATSTIYSISQDNILLEQIRARDEAIAHEIISVNNWRNRSVLVKKPSLMKIIFGNRWSKKTNN